MESVCFMTKNSIRKFSYHYVYSIQYDCLKVSFKFPIDGQDDFLKVSLKSTHGAASPSEWSTTTVPSASGSPPWSRSIIRELKKFKCFFSKKISECFNWSSPWQLFNNLWNLKSIKWKWFWKSESCNRSSRGSDS